MLKSIGSSLRRKQASHRKDQEDFSVVSDAVKLFFEENLGMGMKESGTWFQWSRDSLEIHAGNKVIANELTIRFSELAPFLQKRHITPSKIVIR